MKQKLLFIFLFISATAHICSAKDSTLVFKVAAGINYNHLVFENNYAHLNSWHGGSGSTVLKNKDTSGFAPVFKMAIQKKITKQVGLYLQVSYYRSKLDYTVDYNYHAYTMGDPSSSAFFPGSFTSYTIHHVLIAHNFSESFGPAFYIKQFYVVPKVNFSQMQYISNGDSTGSFNNNMGGITSGQSSSKSKKSKATGGVGLAVGYDFKIGKLILYAELQADYYDQPRNFYSRNGFNASFTAGIGL